MNTIFSVLIRLGDHHFYNVIIASHGTLIIFFTWIPICLSLANYIISTSNVTFSRLNNINFWLLSFAIILLLGSIFVELGMVQNCQSEWFSYSILFSLFLSGISYILSVVNILITFWTYLVSQSIFAVIYIPFSLIVILFILINFNIFNGEFFTILAAGGKSSASEIVSFELWSRKFHA